MGFFYEGYIFISLVLKNLEKYKKKTMVVISSKLFRKTKLKHCRFLKDIGNKNHNYNFLTFLISKLPYEGNRSEKIGMLCMHVSAAVNIHVFVGLQFKFKK